MMKHAGLDWVSGVMDLEREGITTVHIQAQEKINDRNSQCNRINLEKAKGRGKKVNT